MKSLLAITLCLGAMLGFAMDAAAEMRVGWLERAQLEPSGFVLKAKMDTGAKTASLHAMDIQVLRRNGKAEVAFRIFDDQGRETRLQLPLVRVVRIKRHRVASQERPVVMMTVCLGGHKKAAEVSLIDRSRFKYKLLIGRRYMEGVMVVDPGATFLTKPMCK